MMHLRSTIIRIPSRLYFLFCSLLSWTTMLAQKNEGDYEYELRSRSLRDVPRSMRDMPEVTEGLEEPPTDFLELISTTVTAETVFWLVVLVIACYIFGKIWKGCSYLLIVYTAIMFYLYIND